MQLPSYHKVTNHSVIQVVHKVFMYLIHFPSDFLSRLFLPPWLKETPSRYSYPITLICDLVLLSFIYHVIHVDVVNMHSQLRFHRMKYGVLDSHEKVMMSTILIIIFLNYGVIMCISY